MTVDPAAYVDDPLHLDASGATAATDRAGWLRDLVAQVLFTAPGERVHRPELGSGLLQLTFAGASPELASTVQFLVQGSLQQWLSHLIDIESVQVDVEDAQVTVQVVYAERRTGQRFAEAFQTSTFGAGP
ncbi:GPW/gp25 family protein [Pseudonocardia broussonetiae]|uniref:GPW/gp25 family protein n=1 Tax=Pseudonocardia broussonetiae TaxID=2736640 RepID=UPI0019664422|nr:GPW/gp25 family protein [Pseudonocardia broussonetiae]